MASAGFQTCGAAEKQSGLETLPEKRQECVLLIEDSEEAMLLVRYAMQDYGNGVYRLEWADGLTAGLKRLEKGGIDLVLLDLGLPETSGAASYAAIRNAVPDLPVLVLTGDTREQTESAVTANGVEDYLVKDEVSGSLLLQAIRTALYSNKRWQDRKHSAQEQTQRFHWASEKCEALRGLGLRLVRLNRAEAAIACGKAIAAIAHNFGEGEGGTVDGQADLLVTLERLARAANKEQHKDQARQFRAMMIPAHSDDPARLAVETALHDRISKLDASTDARDEASGAQEHADLAQTLRQILESIPANRH